MSNETMCRWSARAANPNRALIAQAVDERPEHGEDWLSRE